MEEDKFLTKEEFLQLQVNDSLMTMYRLREDSLEYQTQLINTKIELLKTQTALLISDREKVARGILSLQNKKDLDKTEHLKFKQEIQERLNLPEKWGFNPDTLKIVE